MVAEDDLYRALRMNVALWGCEGIWQVPCGSRGIAGMNFTVSRYYTTGPDGGIGGSELISRYHDRSRVLMILRSHAFAYMLAR